MFNYLANPVRFLRLTSRLQPITILIAVIAIGLGLYYAIIKSLFIEIASQIYDLLITERFLITTK